jgi:hypothetical protein
MRKRVLGNCVRAAALEPRTQLPKNAVAVGPLACTCVAHSHRCSLAVLRGAAGALAAREARLRYAVLEVFAGLSGHTVPAIQLASPASARADRFAPWRLRVTQFASRLGAFASRSSLRALVPSRHAVRLPQNTQRRPHAPGSTFPDDTATAALTPDHDPRGSAQTQPPQPPLPRSGCARGSSLTATRTRRPPPLPCRRVSR